MTQKIIDRDLFPRVQIGYNSLNRLIEALGSTNSQVTLVYCFDKLELIITDDVLIKKLDLLNIEYTYIGPQNSVKFIKEVVNK